jgi:glucose-1-phosphate cytidylyltransferase
MQEVLVKAVILAGGLGTRIGEETHTKPKPMVEIGGRPILWHIMKSYSHHGINDFVICLGYRGYVIKEYFFNYSLHMSDVTFNLARNELEVHRKGAEPWTVTLVETGEQTMTGGRLKRVQNYLGKDEFCFTYGDGVSDVNITELIAFHRAGGKQATVTAVRPPGRYGAVQLARNRTDVTGFVEKPESTGLINGGYFVLHPDVISYIQDDSTSWEREPMKALAKAGQLRAYEHAGFWQPMDTLREKNYLDSLIAAGNAPWMQWNS